MSNTYVNEGRPSFPAAAAIAAGQACVLNSNAQLTPVTTALIATSKTCPVFFAVTAAASGEPCAAKIAGNAPGTVLAVAAAGSYTTGAPVYLADGGKVTVTAPSANGRIVGLYVGKAVTAAAGNYVEIAPVYAPIYTTTTTTAS